MTSTLSESLSELGACLQLVQGGRGALVLLDEALVHIDQARSDLAALEAGAGGGPGTWGAAGGTGRGGSTGQEEGAALQEADAARDQVCNASAGALGDYCRGVEALVEHLRA